MFALPNLVDLLANEFARLGGRRLALAFVLPGTLNGILQRHGSSSISKVEKKAPARRVLAATVRLGGRLVRAWAGALAGVTARVPGRAVAPARTPNAVSLSLLA
jgi:hypothetical protein